MVRIVSVSGDQSLVKEAHVMFTSSHLISIFCLPFANIFVNVVIIWLEIQFFVGHRVTELCIALYGQLCFSLILTIYGAVTIEAIHDDDPVSLIKILWL
jgi:hypothetical protein